MVKQLQSYITPFSNRQWVGWPIRQRLHKEKEI